MESKNGVQQEEDDQDSSNLNENDQLNGDVFSMKQRVRNSCGAIPNDFNEFLDNLQNLKSLTDVTVKSG